MTEQVLAYQRRRLSDHEAIDLIGARPAADVVRHPGALVRAATSDADRLLGTLHAAEHSQIAVLPLLAMCDRWDIGGLSTNYHAQTGGPTIFIYDGHPGGIGIARRGFEAFERAGRRRLPARQRVPVRVGLPVLRAVAEVRQPQRAAGQGRLRRADGARCYDAAAQACSSGSGSIGVRGLRSPTSR